MLELHKEFLLITNTIKQAHKLNYLLNTLRKTTDSYILNFRVTGIYYFITMNERL